MEPGRHAPNSMVRSRGQSFQTHSARAHKRMGPEVVPFSASRPPHMRGLGSRAGAHASPILTEAKPRVSKPVPVPDITVSARAQTPRSVPVPMCKLVVVGLDQGTPPPPHTRCMCILSLRELVPMTYRGALYGTTGEKRWVLIQWEGDQQPSSQGLWHLHRLWHQ